MEPTAAFPAIPQSRLNIEDIHLSIARKVIIQAVHDLRALQKRGMVTRGVCRNKWPLRKNGRHVNFLNYYRTRQRVEELLDFFKKPTLDNWLGMANLRIDPEIIRRELDLPDEK
jgi:hypothetical protein